MEKISLVMAAYNGRHRVGRQMDSVLKQTRQPDEVLIFDDGSTDGTVSEIQDFLKKNDLQNWKLSVNSKNKGWRANFAQAIGSATGDILFLCDQDDVWHPGKIQRMAEIMAAHPEICLLCSNANVVYEGTGVPEARLRKYGTAPLQEIPFSPAHLNVGRPGCTYCIRAPFARRCMRDYWMPLLAHDAVLWEYAAVHDGLYLLNEETIDFMRYGSNASAGGGSRTKDFRIAAFDSEIAYAEAALRMAQEPEIRRPKKKQAMIRRVCVFRRKRVDFLKHPTIGGCFYLLGHIGYYHSYRNWVSDIYCALFT